MDRETRNLLERTTQQARRLLEAELGRQLEGTYDILPDGTITENPGAHLSAGERFFRARLIAAIQHRRAIGESAKDSVASFLRECAFTFLNRIVALRMLEAREIIKPSVSKGEESSGFTNEFLLLAPGLKSLPDKGYRLYLESVFDEIGREVGVLFDRTDLAGQLWPDRPKLLELLELLNNRDLDSVWAADETIGWIYQYFNGDDERRQMRADSPAPRNAREMAVRNQFFTPRYIVEFLTDNTLGRAWYEMQQGKTGLKERCRYLVRRPNEHFLQMGEELPAQLEPLTDPTQEELLRKTISIPYRARKDPRDIRVLDPACGSGHFLLYCFDLLVVIYEEAWESSAGAIRNDYPDKKALLLAVPEMILRHNLYGIDIDPRAAQICSLALWMRAQRSWQGLQRIERPPIRKTNIVIAEPMPGESDLLEDFCQRLDPKLLGQLIREVFQRMRLAGDTGALLRVETDIAELISEARGQWLAEEVPTDRTGDPLLFATSNQRTVFEMERVSADFWVYAEERVFEALHRFTSAATDEEGFRRRLFVDDTERGFAFLDICRRTFDVVLMNPPFGDASGPSRTALETQLSESGRDIGAAFVREAVTRWAPSGYVGALLPTAPWFKPVFEHWRTDVFLGGRARLSCAAHLGGQILDGATVGASPIVVGNYQTQEALVFRLLRAASNELALTQAISDVQIGTGRPLEVFCVSPEEVCVLTGKPFCYWISPQLRRAVAKLPAFEGSGGTVKQGTATADEFRFARSWWEVPDGADQWLPYVKTSEYSPFWDDVTWVGKFRDGLREITATGRARVQGLSFFGRAGVTYPSKAVLGFNPRLHPSGCGFGHTGSVAFSEDLDPLALLGFLGSKPVEYLISLFIGSLQGEAGVHPNHYEVGTVQRIPWPELNESDRRILRDEAGSAVAAVRLLQQFDEVTRSFVSPYLDFSLSVEQNYQLLLTTEANALAAICNSRDLLDAVVTRSYGFTSSDLTSMAQAFEERVPPATGHWRAYFGLSGQDWDGPEYGRRVLSWLFGLTWGRWETRCVSTTMSFTREALTEAPLEEPPARSTNTTLDTPPFRAEVLVDEGGHPLDIVEAIRAVAREIAPVNGGDKLIDESLQLLGKQDMDLRSWIRRECFEDHLIRYSKARRKAPIYWQLSTPSRRYSLWFNYHRLNRDTLWRTLNDLVKPKIAREDQRLTTLRANAGEVPTPSQRRAIQEQASLLAELATFRDDFDTIAPLWSPNLNDGVLLNFSPLWKLVSQPSSWQRELRDCWHKICCGEYDWSHLAMHLWPERVVPKCESDRSLAIAHGLEDIFWEQKPDDKWTSRHVGAAKIKALIEERSSKAVKAALDKLLAHSGSATITRRTRSAARRSS